MDSAAPPTLRPRVRMVVVDDVGGKGVDMIREGIEEGDVGKIAAGVVLLLVAIALFLVCLWWRRRQANVHRRHEDENAGGQEMQILGRGGALRPPSLDLEGGQGNSFSTPL